MLSLESYTRREVEEDLVGRSGHSMDENDWNGSGVASRVSGRLR
jgi:hypothetical protein